MKVENTTKASGRLQKRPKTSKATSKEEKALDDAQKALEQAHFEQNMTLAMKRLELFRGDKGAHFQSI